VPHYFLNMIHLLIN